MKRSTFTILIPWTSFINDHNYAGVDILRQAGVELVPFSPLHKSAFPENIGGIYLGGDFPEEHAERLSANISMREALAQLPADSTAEQIQQVVYEVGRREPFLDKTGKIKSKDGKPGVTLDWFNMLYQILLGQEKGPRFGSFVAVYGLGNTIEMIDGALARSA